MAQYIDKDALVAEIKRLKKKNDAYNKPSHVADVCYKEILSAIGTLEVKEVDLEEIIEQTYHDSSVTDTADIDHVTYENIAKHFFELGLKAQKGE